MSKNPEHERKSLDKLKFGPYEVNFVDNFILSLQNGEKLAINVWFPGKVSKDNFPTQSETILYCDETEEDFKQEDRFPAIMEYLPYRKGQFTAERDYLRHPWMCSQGYVILRVDMRGTGNSTGLYFDEYAKQEQEDACEIIEWISKQSWSNGSVGMFGKSWGGFNGLQVAYCQPPALKAVISIYSTDNRYTDDCHFKGGCVIGIQMLSWAAVMFTWNAQPPHPKKFAGYEDDKTWKREWKKRLETAGESWSQQWLKQQNYNDYWKPGSVCEDYSRIKIPIFAIGGWHDMYSNAVFRLVENLPNCRGLIGPWSHDWPDVALPGPQIGFLSECLDFWDHHLKGKHVEKEEKAPKLSWYQCFGELPPGPSVIRWPGEWRSTSSTQPERIMSYHIGENNQLTSSDSEKAFKLTFDPNAGLSCGEMLSFGAPDLPTEQRFFNHPDHTWTSSILETPIDLFGFPEFFCNFKIINDTQGQLAVKLCDVFPDGQSRLVTFGVANLNHHKSNEKPEEFEPNRSYNIKLELDGIGYKFLPGHRISLSVSPSYWPVAWTPRKSTILEISNGQISLPVVESSWNTPDLYKDPVYGPRLKTKDLEKSDYKRFLNIGFSDGVKTLTTVETEGTKYLFHEDVSFGEKTILEYSIKDSDPLSASATCSHDLKMEYFPFDENHRQKIDISTVSKMTADDQDFYLDEELKVHLNEEVFFHNRWERKVPRNFV